MLLVHHMILWWLFISCATNPKGVDSAHPKESASVPWSGSLQPTAADVAPIRSWQPRRAIMHLHSPWSHDACDGEPLIDGSPDSSCLMDLRSALCATSVDVAYLTDHPAHASEQPYASLFHLQDGDEPVTVDGKTIATRIPCPDGNPILWRPGIEDELMPLGLQSHTVPENPTASHAMYNLASTEAVVSHQGAGAFVSMAHTEGKALQQLQDLVHGGLQGVEIFNLHAMFDPTKRREHLGLDPLSWASDIAPFTSPDGTAEPDLFFIAVLQEQTTSLQKWDALQDIGNVVGFAGTDAHQNVLPIDLRDGERGDSYRRMLRWFSNHLLVDASDTSPSPAAYDSALASGRMYTAFEILGTPTGFDFHLQSDDGQITEMGGSGIGQTLHVQCPTLSPSSPTNGESPTIAATVFRNGEEWAAGCGAHPITEPGSYRLRIDIKPTHLKEFLGDDPDIWLHFYPWVYTNPIRVR